MENQHQKIKGYRDLTQAEIDLMNRVKDLSEQVGALCEELELKPFSMPSEQTADQRWVHIGKTDLQKGFMALVRAIAKPTTF